MLFYHLIDHFSVEYIAFSLELFSYEQIPKEWGHTVKENEYFAGKETLFKKNPTNAMLVFGNIFALLTTNGIKWEYR